MTDAQKVFVPEEHFSEVPDSFSAESVVNPKELFDTPDGYHLKKEEDIHIGMSISV